MVSPWGGHCARSPLKATTSERSRRLPSRNGRHPSPMASPTPATSMDMPTIRTTAPSRCGLAAATSAVCDGGEELGRGCPSPRRSPAPPGSSDASILAVTILPRPRGRNRRHPPTDCRDDGHASRPRGRRSSATTSFRLERCRQPSCLTVPARHAWARFFAKSNNHSVAAHKPAGRRPHTPPVATTPHIHYSRTIHLVPAHRRPSAHSFHQQQPSSH